MAPNTASRPSTARQHWKPLCAPSTSARATRSSYLPTPSSATAGAVRTVGATPVFADVDLDTWNLSTPAVEDAVSERTKAVIPVHFGGLPVDFDSLLPLAQQHGLHVIEDAAHAHGSSWSGHPVGALGTVGSFSFQASKNLTAGEGGALLTNDPQLAERMWSIANCGRSPGGQGYEHPNLGTNLRLSGWQAAVLSAGLTRLDDQLERRMSNARRLRGFLEEFEGLTPQRWDPRADAHSHHIFLMRLRRRAFRRASPPGAHLRPARRKHPRRPLYPYPLYHQPPLVEPYSRITPCPNSELLCQQTISISQNVLLADPHEMDDILHAILKIRENVGAITDH